MSVKRLLVKVPEDALRSLRQLLQSGDMYAHEELVDSVTSLEEIRLALDEAEDVELGVPVCQHCGLPMHACRYEGYYESFDYWDCGCGRKPGAVDNVIMGAYA